MEKYLTEDNTSKLEGWVSFYPKFNSGFYVEKAGYFDERPEVHTSVTQLIFLFTLPFLCFISLWFLLFIPFLLFGWGKLFIHLPIKTGVQDCESAAWGFNYHDNTVWFYIGGGGNFEGGKKWKTFNMPWYHEWYRTSTLLSDLTWYHEKKGFRKNYKGNDYGSYDWIKENRWKDTVPYTDNYDGTIVNATISVEEREWRMNWLYWCPLFNKIRTTINVEFDQEIGSRKGSWKGGTIGCGYNLLPNETPYECLVRMQKEREF